MSRPVNAFARMDEPIHPHGGHAAGGRAKPVTPGAAAVCGVGAELADRALVVTMPADEPRGLGVVRGMEQLDFNLLFRWFVGLAMDDPIWDASVFTKNRERLVVRQNVVRPTDESIVSRPQ